MVRLSKKGAVILPAVRGWLRISWTAALAVGIAGVVPASGAEAGGPRVHARAPAVEASLSHAAAPQMDADRLARSVVYASQDEGPLVERAAQDLTHYIQAVTGVQIPVRFQPPPAGGGAPVFLLGRYAEEDGLQVPETRFGVDGFAVDASGERVRMAGESDRATYFAVARFLELQGIRWYTPGPYGEVVPHCRSLLLPAQPIQETPSLWSRNPWYDGGSQGSTPEDQRQFRLWALRNKAVGGLEVETGHMWSNVVAPLGGLEQLAHDHPDWFFQPRGKPTWRNACILQPGFVQLFVDYYEKRLEGEPRDVRRIFSICPDDGMYDFTCPQCRALISRADPITPNLPDVTDVIVQFANQVLERLNADYPHVRLCTYIYANFESAPRHVTPSPNLIPMFAPLSFDRYHRLDDPRSPRRILLARVVEDWAHTSGFFGWYDYSYLCPDAFMPFTRLHMVSHDLPWLYRHGLRYWVLETTKNWPNYMPDYYLAARLTWDVDLDQQQLLDEYYRLYFGPAGPAMKAYITGLEEAYSSLTFSAGNKEFMGAVFTPARLDTLRSWMDQALEAVAGDTLRLHRVRMFDHVLRQGERFMAMRRAFDRCDFAAAQGLNEQIRSGFREGRELDPLISNRFVEENWYEAFYGKHVEQVDQWTRDARIVYVFPDEWPAYFDFARAGEGEGAYRPDSPLFDFFTLKTYSACLAQQGWERYRGPIWYRRRFTLPDSPARSSGRLQVLLAGVDSQATVWVDGQRVGEGGGGTFDPVLLDLPALPPGEHTLTVRVSNEVVTELGTGGIIRPVCILAGS